MKTLLHQLHYMVTTLSIAALSLFYGCQHKGDTEIPLRETERSQGVSKEEIRDLVVNPKKVDLSKLRFDFTANIIGADYSIENNKMYYWSTQGLARFGTYTDTDPGDSFTYTFTPASGKIPSEIAEVAIWAAVGVNRCYAYYLDGTYSIGVSNILDYYSAPAAYTLPTGMSPSNIIGLSINSSGNAYTWYNNGTYSIGTPSALGSISASSSYSLPPGRTYADIVAIAIDRSDSNKVYTWYINDTVSIGTPSDLDFYSAPVYFD